MTFEVDEWGYEKTDHVVVNDKTIRIGDVYTCCCKYEIVKIGPRWDIDSKKVIEGGNFFYKITYLTDCVIHGRAATKMVEP